MGDIEISDIEGTVIIHEGKSLEYRSIPLNTYVRNAILDYLKVRPLTLNKRLIQGERGNLTRSAIFKIIQKHAQHAGIEEVSPHTLRHQFCKDLLNNGTTISTVAILAGHSSTITAAIYTQHIGMEKTFALEKL